MVEKFIEDTNLDHPISVGVVASSFNQSITDRLLESATTVLQRHSVQLLDVIWVSGAFEIPATLKVMALSGRYNALVALGCVIRGETPHFEYICSQCAAGCMQVSVDAPIPVGFGVLTVDNREQALARSKIDGDNKGAEAAAAVVRSAHAVSRIRMPI